MDKTFISTGGINYTPGPETIHETIFLGQVEVAGIKVDLSDIPGNLSLHKEIGLLTNRYVSVQVVYRIDLHALMFCPIIKTSPG